MDTLPDSKRKCHCTGFTKSCRKLVVDGHCQGRWLQLLGTHPQTGEARNVWDCIDNHAHVLRLALVQQQAQTGAGVDRMRHEAQQRHDGQTSQLVEALRLTHEVMSEPQPLQVEYQRQR